MYQGKGIYLDGQGYHKRIARHTVKWLDLVITSSNLDSFMTCFRVNAARYRVLDIDNKVRDVFNNLEIL